MIEGKLWIVLFALPSFLMVRLLFKKRTGADAKMPKLIYFFFALVIAVSVSPVVSLIGYGVLDELVGSDWLNLHPKGLGTPDPLFELAIPWSVYGGLLGAILAIHVHLIPQWRLPRKFRISTIAMALATIAMALFSAGVLWFAIYIDSLGCVTGVQRVVDMDWERQHQGTLLFNVDGEMKNDVFYEAIKQLERRNFSVCYEYLDPDGANNARPCVSSCGASTSLQEGLIVAERVGLARGDDQVVRYWSTKVVLGVASAEGGTKVVGSWVFGGRLARTDWDGDLGRAEGPRSGVQTRDIWIETSQNLGPDIRQGLKDDN